MNEQQHVGAANRTIGKRVQEPTIHPANLSNKDRVEMEARYRQSIAHLPPRRQRKMLVKVGLDIPDHLQPGDHAPQVALSRRTRRAMARGQAKQRKGLEKAVQPVAAPAKPKAQDPIYGLTLKEIRQMAQERGIRVDGKRPSLCSKAELIAALE